MPYIARTSTLPEEAVHGGLVDPRSSEKPSFGERMSCRDITEFIYNRIGSSPLESRYQKAGSELNGAFSRFHKESEYQAKLERILARSREIRLPRKTKDPSYPLLDLLPNLIVTGGLSRSPAFDGLPVVSHWADRVGEPSAEDPAATFRLTSTWSTIVVRGEGAAMNSPQGAPCWALTTHGIGPALGGSSKFSQQYLPETDTLVTTVNLARRPDTPRTGGLLTAAANVSWMRNTRVADAVDCAIGLLADASQLLETRDNVIMAGKTERTPFAEVREVVMPTWCSARKPLAPKLSGVALSPDQGTADLFAAEGCEGALLNTSVFAMSVGYNRGVYAGSISGLWAIMDSAFVMDYSVGITSTAMSENLSCAFADVAAVAEESVSAGPHISDIRVVKACNYACLRQKTVIEDAHPVPSRPCIVVWDDLARLARYKLADAVFCHVYYDSGGGEYMASIAGLGCVAHDWIDMGADIACGEISNIIATLTRGSLNEKPLAEVYSRLTGAMIWYRDNDPYNPAATCILLTHWWQLSNCRHRPIALLGRTDIDVSKGIVPILPEERPPLEHFRACGTKIERDERPLANAEARLQSLISSDPLPETRAVIDILVKPVLAYLKGADHLPAESEYVGATLAAQLAYPQGQKIVELWDLAIVMWESGAMWASGIAGLCYTHTGNFNCDRARDDLSNTTWA
ncbi:hypothetical protein BDV59DRAFT_192564 [Aspergillus ambiguus]|uniref:uncharacterized protein n=1 Tax=Aspergillus ambiguus TaxID=176160 RepID=UPI003CCD7340